MTNKTNITSIFARLNDIKQKIADIDVDMDSKVTTKYELSRTALTIARRVEDSYTRRYMYCESLKKSYEAKFMSLEISSQSLREMKNSNNGMIACKAAIRYVNSLMIIIECVQIQYESFCALKEFNAVNASLEELVSFFNSVRQDKDIRIYLKALLSSDVLFMTDVYDELVMLVEDLEQALSSEM